jgi:hypothetical protein
MNNKFQTEMNPVCSGGEVFRDETLQQKNKNNKRRESLRERSDNASADSNTSTNSEPSAESRPN